MQVVFLPGIRSRGRKVLLVSPALRGILESLGTFTQVPRDPMETQETKAYLGIRVHLDHLKTEVEALI